VKHLRERGLEALTFAGREDDDRKGALLAFAQPAARHSYDVAGSNSVDSFLAGPSGVEPEPRTSKDRVLATFTLGPKDFTIPSNLPSIRRQTRYSRKLDCKATDVRGPDVLPNGQGKLMNHRCFSAFHDLRTAIERRHDEGARHLRRDLLRMRFIARQPAGRGAAPRHHRAQSSGR
jgi:hypothetical protein